MPYQKALQGELYFLTMTVVDWIDVFTREIYFQCIIDNLVYCQEHKNLEIFCYVIMTNHIHLIARCQEQALYNILRDFKTYTSKQLFKLIVKNKLESKRRWMEYIFCHHGIDNRLNKWHQFWQNGNHAKVLYRDWFIEQKINYIHQNPVRAGFVNHPENWRYSSASQDSPINVSEIWASDGRRLI